MLKKLRNCFSDEEVNLSRQRELDVARGIAIIFMVFSHSYEMFSRFFDPAVSAELGRTIIERIIGGTAPLLIILIGVNLRYSRRATPSTLAVRGVRMLGIAYLLEIARVLLPALMVFAITKDFDCFVTDMDYIWEIDILHFAALSMLLIALFKALKLRVRSMLLISVAMSLIGWGLQWVSTGNDALDILLSVFLRTRYTSFFPLFNWFVMVVVGYAFGALWQRLRDKDTFFKLLTPISLTLTVAYFAVMTLTGKFYYFSNGDFFGVGTIELLPLIVVALSMTGVAYYISKWSSLLARFLASMGGRITSIYCVHWVIYGFLTAAIFIWLYGTDLYLTQWSMLFAPIVILIASDLLSRLYSKQKKKIIAKKI